MKSKATFLRYAVNNERLHILTAEGIHIERMAAVYYHTDGVRPYPVAHGKLRVLPLVGYTPYEDGVFLGTQLVV